MHRPLPAVPRRDPGAACFILILALGLLVSDAPRAGAESPSAPGGGAEVVTVKNFDFSSRTVTIGRGRTIRWANEDVANHQISSGVVEGGRPKPDGHVSSPLLVRGDVFSATFPRAGEYPYYCGVHPFMRGMIVVK